MTPDEPKYLSIPIPPASRPRKSLLLVSVQKLKRYLSKPKALHTKTPPEFVCRETAHERLHKLQRKVELFHAVLLAVIVNIAIVLLLSFLNGVEHDYGDPIVITATTSAPEEPSLEKSSLKRSDKQPSPPRLKTSSNAVVANSISPIPFPDFDDSNFDSLPLGWDDFGSANGGGGGSSFGATGLGTVGSVFQNAGVTDGRGTILFIDTSGSMKKHTENVARFVQRHFPQAAVERVSGCAFTETRGFVPMLANCPPGCTKIFFVCDLHDEITDEGLQLLRIHLSVPEKKQLHIISYSKEPVIPLRWIIAEFNGSFTMFSKKQKH